MTGARGVHLWVVDLGPGSVRAPESWLAPDEVARADRFRSAADRRRYVGSRAALRGVLAETMGLRPDEVRFAYGAKGKPELHAKHGPAGIQFNLSHSGDLALVAVSHGRRVGVDIERQRPMPDLDDLVDRFFHPAEKRAFATLPVTDREAAFFVCWTRKEAYLKGIGEGLTGGLASFAVSFLPHERPALLEFGSHARPAGPWTLVDVSPSPGFTATLAAEGQDLQLRRLSWPS